MTAGVGAALELRQKVHKGHVGREPWDRHVHIGNRGLKGTVRKDENVMNSVGDIQGACYTDYGTQKRRGAEHAGTASRM